MRLFANPRRDKPALLLTLGMWGFCLLALSGPMVARYQAFPEWLGPFLGLTVASGMALSAILYMIVVRLERAPAAWRWPAVIVATLVVAAIQALGDHAIFRATVGWFGKSVSGDFEGVALNFVIYVWLFGLYAVALELISTTALATARERQAAEALALAQEAQLQALRFQLNPHFLFNTLNAISGLIVTGRNRDADLMMVKLASFLRNTLYSEEKPLVPLVDELASTEDYLAIEGVRFPAIGVEVACHEALFSAVVPNLILQPLVENAVRYAIAPSNGAGAIRIEAAARNGRLHISVTDTGAPDAHLGGQGSGVGLENTRRRLAALYGDDGKLETAPSDTGFTARLSLPLSFAPASETSSPHPGLTT